MRNSIKFGLIGCVLLFVLGLGWCIQHPDKVHDWLPPWDHEPLAEDEFVVPQRSSGDVPGLDGAVKVGVGDIKRGKTADVEIIGPDSVTLASKQGAQVGDRIAFTHEGQQYQIEVLQYHDELGSGDSATFKIIPPEGDKAAPAK